jgi:hypothetical protein
LIAIVATLADAAVFGEAEIPIAASPCPDRGLTCTHVALVVRLQAQSRDACSCRVARVSSGPMLAGPASEIGQRSDSGPVSCVVDVAPPHATVTGTTNTQQCTRRRTRNVLAQLSPAKGVQTAASNATA